MAENKKSFVLYSDLIHTVRKMPKDKAGELFMVILEYVNDENPTVNDLLVDLVFEPVKQSLKRDLLKYEDKKEIRSNAGQIANLKRWNLDLYERFFNKEISLETALDLAKNRKTSESDKIIPKIPVNVNDNVNDNVSVNDILLEKETKNKNFDFRKKLMDFGFKEKLVDDWLKVRKTKKATNTETAFNKFIGEVQKANKDPNEILEICISKDWKGFQMEWLNNIQTQNYQNSSSTKIEKNR